MRPTRYINISTVLGWLVALSFLGVYLLGGQPHWFSVAGVCLLVLITDVRVWQLERRLAELEANRG